MNIATFFLLSTLVLRSGQHIDIDGPWHEDHGRIIFRTVEGTLYSVPKDEVDLDTTRAMSVPPLVTAPSSDRVKLKVSEEEKKRLIAELEKNHSGLPSRERTVGVEMVPEAPRPNTDEEWNWRNRARDYEERIRQARENRELLITRTEALRSHISGLLSLGYKPSQFTYDSSQLQYMIEAIPNADLDLTRAERAYAQFRDDARRMDVPPGWLR